MKNLSLIDAENITRLSPYPELINAIEDAFKGNVTAPERHHYDVGNEAAPVTLLSMPAWETDEFIGQKLVTVAPGNADIGLETIQGVYVLMSAKTGLPLAVMDAPELTARRTAAASALAARYLTRGDAKTLLMVGTGKLSSYLIEAHAAVREYETIYVWGRSFEKAQAVCDQVNLPRMRVEAVDDLAAAVRKADTVSCATTSSVPIVKGEWLKAGSHLDLVGAFKATMRESDDAAIAGAKVFADTVAGVMGEGGDILQAIQSGAISDNPIAADLTMLATGQHAGRSEESERTVFKSVGAAVEDYAIARLVYQNLSGR
jgi:ornithine cyclodeaminase